MKTSIRVGLILITISVAQFATCAHAGPPLPFHSIEGVGGGAITPMAYLVNPEPEGAVFGKPAFAFTYVNMGRKNHTTFSVTETLFGRIELGYAAARMGLGTLPADIRDATALDCGRSDVWLHHFNARLLLLEENTCLGGFAMPAVTAGVHVKVNDGIRDIDRNLNSALSQIGYTRENGEDFTLTFTKTVTPESLGRPLILTGGLRESQGAQLGLLGFGNKYYTTFEGSIVFLPFDHIALAYEYRQKPDPYGRIAGLIGNEDDWHGFDVAVILNDQTTFCAGYGILGTVANTEENGAWWLQLKHEF